MTMQRSIQPKYTLTEDEHKTKSYPHSLADNTGRLSDENSLTNIEGHDERGDINMEELAELYAGIEPDSEISDAVEVLDALIKTEYRDAQSFAEERQLHDSALEQASSVVSMLEEKIDIDFEHTQYLHSQLERIDRRKRSTFDTLSRQEELLESLDELARDRELIEFSDALKRGEPLTKTKYRIDLIQEYCRMVFSELPPDQALPDLIAIREHYGNENSNSYGQYPIGRMIAGCHAALGQMDEAKADLPSKAHEGFGLMRRYTDFCLAFGFYEDLIEFVQANDNGERHLAGGYATAQMIMSYILLGQAEDALPHLKARVNARIRDQQLIDNIWSLKLLSGERPEGREVLSVNRSKLRTFGKKNLEIVADTVDTLLAEYECKSGQSLLDLWSTVCTGSKYFSNLHLISVPGILNPSEELRFVKERNLRYYVEVDVMRYSFIGHQCVQAFLAKVIRLAEDLTKTAGRNISSTEIDDTELRSLLKIKAVDIPEPLDLEAIVPSSFHAEPLKFDINYKPPPENYNRFQELTWLIPQTYSKRDSDSNAIDKTVALCEEQIKLSYDIAHYDTLRWHWSFAQRKRNSVRFEHHPEYQRHYLDIEKFGLRKCIGFERLAIIHEKQGDYEAALRCVVRARTEGWPGEWDKRIQRLLKKMNK